MTSWSLPTQETQASISAACSSAMGFPSNFPWAQRSLAARALCWPPMRRPSPPPTRRQSSSGSTKGRLRTTAKASSCGTPSTTSPRRRATTTTTTGRSPPTASAFHSYPGAREARRPAHRAGAPARTLSAHPERQTHGLPLARCSSTRSLPGRRRPSRTPSSSSTRPPQISPSAAGTSATAGKVAPRSRNTAFPRALSFPPEDTRLSSRVTSTREARRREASR